MRALIMGAGLKNKGAELMLRALVSEMRARHPNVELGLSSGVPGYTTEKSLGLAKLNVPLTNVGYRLRFLPGWALRNLIPDGVGGWAWNSVDLILDVSGFAYSDQWRVSAARNLKRVAADVRKRGGHVLLFPQAFGPFELPGHADAMRRALNYVTRAYARDPTSLSYLEALGSDCPVGMAPDITLSFETQSIDVESEWVAVVPNIRMLDQGAAVWGSRYVSTLNRIIERVLDSGLEVRLLVHDTSGDDEAVARELGWPQQRVPIVRHEDPVALKHVLARARFVVGSRFHALASSLACGVPAMALGWSHKYRELLSSYGLAGFDIGAPDDPIQDRLDELLDDQTRHALRTRILVANQRFGRESERMWSEVGEFMVDIRSSRAEAT